MSKKSVLELGHTGTAFVWFINLVTWGLFSGYSAKRGVSPQHSPTSMTDRNYPWYLRLKEFKHWTKKKKKRLLVYVLSWLIQTRSLQRNKALGDWVVGESLRKQDVVSRHQKSHRPKLCATSGLEWRRQEVWNCPKQTIVPLQQCHVPPAVPSSPFPDTAPLGIHISRCV